jgi:hypothetical protein
LFGVGPNLTTELDEFLFNISFFFTQILVLPMSVVKVISSAKVLLKKAVKLLLNAREKAVDNGLLPLFFRVSLLPVPDM